MCLTAKSHLTLFNPMDCSPHGLQFLCPWNSPGKITVVGCHFLLQGWMQVSCMSCTGRQILLPLSCLGSWITWLLFLQRPSESESEVAQSCPTLRDCMDCSPPGSSSMGFSRQEYWSGLPFLSPENLPDLGIEPRSPAKAKRQLKQEHVKEKNVIITIKI